MIKEYYRLQSLAVKDTGPTLTSANSINQSKKQIN